MCDIIRLFIIINKMTSSLFSIAYFLLFLQFLIWKQKRHQVSSSDEV